MTNNPAHAFRATAFTLIGLLVVISVIAILAAILFPVFATAREQGRKTACLSNEHQIGLGLMQYVQDNDEIYPNGVQETAVSDVIWAGEGWVGQCAPYIRDVAIFACPDDPTPPSSQNSVVSFGYNFNYVEQNQSAEYDAAVSGISEGSVSAPSSTVLLFEVSNVTSNLSAPLEGSQSASLIGRNLSASGNGLDNRLYAQTNDTTSVQNQYATGYLGGRAPFDVTATQFSEPAGRHTGGSNFLLGDGHAKWLRGSSVSSGLEPALPVCFQDNVPAVSGCANGASTWPGGYTSSWPGQYGAAGSDALSPTFQATFSTI